MGTENNSEEQFEIHRKFREQTVVRLMRQISRYMYQEIDRRMQLRGHTGLSARHFQVFEYLDLQGSNITQLAQRAGITKQAMSKLVQQIVEVGYIEVHHKPNDFRSYDLHLTKSGFKFLEDAREEVIKTRALISGIIDADEYRRFTETLTKILHYFEQKSENEPVE